MRKQADEIFYFISAKKIKKQLARLSRRH